MKLGSKITVSAPGKLLFAGGYLVLESPNVGVVIAVDKRFYCTAEVFVEENKAPVIEIHVASPQFDQVWSYEFNKTSKTFHSSPTTQSENVFVEKTLRVSLLALLDDERHENVCQIKLTIQGDNDFYSLIPHLKERGEPKTLSAALALPQFLPAARVNGKIVKTGLGSSACLVTSLVASLWYSLQEKDQTTVTGMDMDTIFRLAQICHCHSQGKVGSGFDVAAACYGSHIYERFPKSLLADLLSMLDDERISTEELQLSVRSILQAPWDGGIRAPLALPSFLQVMLADVSGGSESPSMARTVLSWKRSISTTRVPHWDDLTEINQEIASLLQTLSLQTIDDVQMQTLISTTDPGVWNTTEIGKLMLELRATAEESRRHLKAMGDLAGVPIEPDEQTALVDATLKVPGVIAALVPGAGGYDAIACLHVNHPRVRHAVADFWCAWPHASVCPLTVQGAASGDGIKLESIN
eukprot:scaffold1581_cov169-Amphora_coffeaeformis.AAC.40